MRLLVNFSQNMLSACIISRRTIYWAQWRTQKISAERAKFRHNHVMSQINFRESAEGTTILGGPGACPREIFVKSHLKVRIFVHSGSKF